MIKNILFQQQEERNGLLQQVYIPRIENEAIVDFLNTTSLN